MQKFLLLLSLTLSLLLLSNFQAHADDHEDESFYLSISELSVKLGHTQAFMDGVKAVRDCYQEAGGKEPWWLWNRVQGPGNVFVVTSTYKNWQGFFADDSVGEGCRGVVRDKVVPHIDSTYHNMASYLPDWSSIETTGGNFVAVYNFKVNNYELFESTVAAIEEGLKDDGGPGAAWYYTMGGRGQADYFVVEYFTDPKALDADDPGVWQRLEAAVGKEKSSALQQDFRKSIGEWWTYLYALHEDLSYAATSAN
ncbi:hypothetical protein PSI9734_02232 [Pseudidiomarina piscicola]|uniref:NIPSNAP domain-containing protein n=1 Tax=Pseudidiomarina piscicola TaxID=2614830 RepID=A0A6S6WPA6_9GAMM|nr:hypothetical protein [Pseudidiomarina piscicola]CAB0151872.1 hypothetical protein PSI9734_02232 [Pseudidiomarina piscicola]VZT41318.1 hypothetical protein PSI9734_02232 [Pseudomonas aeruginosa]